MYTIITDRIKSVNFCRSAYNFFNCSKIIVLKKDCYRKIPFRGFNGNICFQVPGLKKSFFPNFRLYILAFKRTFWPIFTKSATNVTALSQCIPARFLFDDKSCELMFCCAPQSSNLKMLPYLRCMHSKKCV